MWPIEVEDFRVTNRFYCVSLDYCDSVLELDTRTAERMTMADFYQRYGWSVSASWDDGEWDGTIFCPEHEDEASEFFAHAEDDA